MWNNSFPSVPNSVTLYLPGATPSEKYSPFLLSFRLYFRPVSWLSHSTVPVEIGLPSASRATPLTEPVACANAGDTHSPSTSATSATIAKRCFIESLPAFSTPIFTIAKLKQFQISHFRLKVADLTWTLLAAQLPGPINLKSKISNQRSI